VPLSSVFVLFLALSFVVRPTQTTTPIFSSISTRVAERLFSPAMENHTNRQNARQQRRSPPVTDGDSTRRGGGICPLFGVDSNNDNSNNSDKISKQLFQARFQTAIQIRADPWVNRNKTRTQLLANRRQQISGTYDARLGGRREKPTHTRGSCQTTRW
jgi:hypothetical protein